MVCKGALLCAIVLILLAAAARGFRARAPVKVPLNSVAPAQAPERAKVPVGVVRVAAIQCYSRMGALTENRRLLTILITEAVEKGAQLVVLPECAVPGYMQPAFDQKWTSKEKCDENELFVGEVAEPVPGPSTRYFGDLCRRTKIYLALPLIERSDEKYFNTLVLLGPEGQIEGQHRKQSLWNHGDSLWATAGDRPTQVVQTPYGRVGLMVCHDLHVMPAKLKQAGAQIVLYSVGWYGPNTRSWFEEVFPEKYVVPHGFAVVAANWSCETEDEPWQGIGHSCVIAPDGKLLAMARSMRDCELVIADLSLKSLPEK